MFIYKFISSVSVAVSPFLSNSQYSVSSPFIVSLDLLASKQKELLKEGT